MRKPGIQQSEWVSLGHPDKMADYITSYILDRYLEADPLTRYAVEVMVKDWHIFLAGEVTSKARFGFDELHGFAQDAVREIGYTLDYQDKWGHANTVAGDSMSAEIVLSAQSPDIAQGVNGDVGWGDQGIFWGMAVADPETGYVPRDHWYARKIGEAVASSGLCGLDVKTLVSTNEGEPYRVICAAPVLTPEAEAGVCAIIRGIAPGAEIVLNGTGRFVTHGPVGDSGVTGRKLAVDFYGGNCRVGGGSPWGKDATKADVALNLYARKLALAEVQRGATQTCFCSLACAIGQPDLEVCLYDAEMRIVGYRRESRPAREIIDELGLRKPGYAARCREGLFSAI